MSRESRTQAKCSNERTRSSCAPGGPASPSGAGAAATITKELKAHAPFTTLGTLTGVGLMLAIVMLEVPRSASVAVFWSLHPLHVFLSALVTTAMYALHGPRNRCAILAIGYLGSVGIATLSDCVIPYVGEILLNLPNRGIHLGFVEKWWLVNPLAAAGIVAGYFWPHTKFPHAGHVLLSTWASLFHMVMALGTEIGVGTYAVAAVFLFLAVWVPCCTSDIVFPLLFLRSKPSLPKRGADDRQPASGEPPTQ